MITLELLAVAVALGCDAFSVAIGVGAIGLSKRRIFRLSFHFALFQFMMPLIGLAIGQIASTLIGVYGHWVAAIGLAAIGINMIRQAFKSNRENSKPKDPTRGFSLIILSVSTSIDALIVGFGLGLMGLHVLMSCVVIGIAAGIMTITGMFIGAGAARAIGKWAEVFGGVVLLILAVSFLI